MKLTKQFLTLALLLLAVIMLFSACGVSEMEMPVGGFADINETEDEFAENTAFLLSSASSSVQSPSGVSYAPRVSCAVTTKGAIKFDGTANTAAVVTFTLADPPESGEITFDYKAVSGSMDASDLTETISGSITLSKAKLTESVTIDISTFADENESGRANPKNAYWTGEHVFYLYCDDIKNALFTGDKESLIVPVAVESDFDYQSFYSSAVSSHSLTVDDLPLGTEYSLESGSLEASAAITDEVRKLIDAGVYSHITLPQGSLENSSEDEKNPMYNIYSARDGAYSDPAASGRSYTLPAKDSTAFYSEDEFPQTVGIGSVGLGAEKEQNGIFNGLVLKFEGGSGVSVSFEENPAISFSDEAAPTVTGVFADALSAKHGDEIPVVIEFSEPVCVDDISCKIGTKTY